MKFSQFPQEIIDKVRERTIEQGNEFDITVYDETIHQGRRGGGMNWSSTPEHHNFWEQVLKKQNFDVFFKKYPKHEGFELPFREGDIVKCVKNTFDGNTECIGKYFCLTAQNARELNNGGTAILNSYPSGERNEFEVNYSADLLIISNRSETILNNNNKILQHESIISSSNHTNSGSDCSIQGQVYSKQGRAPVLCGY